MRVPGSITPSTVRPTIPVAAPVTPLLSPTAPAARAQAPLPSGGTLAQRTPPPASARSLFDLRVQGAQPARELAPPDGNTFCQAALADIRRRVASGEKCSVVFDLDNTLFDARFRTLEVARAYDAANGTRHFSGLTPDLVGLDGTETCKRLGLPEDVAAAFQKHWNVEFWNGHTMKFDTPIPSMVKLAHEAKAAGADVVYLTGRIEKLAPHSLAQLVRAGLPDATADHLFSKPDLKSRTGEYKAAQLDVWQAAGVHIGFFVTEGRRDIGTIQKTNPDVPCVLLRCSLEPLDHAINPDTPQFPPEY